MKAHRSLGITQKRAWHLPHRLSECWQEFKELLARPVEVETYIGGKRKNMAKHKGKQLSR